jgi:hypothetical protein
MKLINTLFGQNAEILNDKIVGTYSYHRALKVSNDLDCVCKYFACE